MIWWVVKDEPKRDHRDLCTVIKGSLNLVHLEAQNNVIFNTVRPDGWKITQICEKFESWKRARLFHREPFVFPSPTSLWLVKRE
jgi:hypothetical protein